MKKLHFLMTRKEALAHYERMIKWAKTQPKKADVSEHDMVSAIKEAWSADYCPYCKKMTGKSCRLCPLCRPSAKTLYLGACCGGLWYKLDLAETWGEWLKYATKIYDFIDRNGIKQPIGDDTDGDYICM